MNTRIRPATIADAPSIVTLIAEAGYPAAADGVLRVLARRDVAMFPTVVAELKGAVVGLLVVCCRPSLMLQGWVGTIAELVVSPAHRRAEIGEALLHYAKGLAVERGLVRLECAVPGAHDAVGGSFLLDRGFERGDVRTYRWSVLESKHPRLPAVAARRLVSV
jgi:N-acetylglutamate synthase-like GNAT family acetyltransferase